MESEIGGVFVVFVGGGDLRNLFFGGNFCDVNGRDLSEESKLSETLCTLLDIQIGIFELRDSARFISSINRARTRISAFSNRRKRAFCFGPPLSLSVDDEENEQDDDNDDDDDEDE